MESIIFHKTRDQFSLLKGGGKTTEFGRGSATPSSGLGVGWPVKFGELKNMPLDQMKVSVQEKQCGRHHGIP
jgi:hypothetical protein